MTIAQPLDLLFPKVIENVEQLRLKVERRVPGKRQFNEVAPAGHLDLDGITRAARDFRLGLDERNSTHIGRLPCLLGCKKPPMRPEVTGKPSRCARIFVFITLLPALNQERANVHFIRHASQLGRVHAKPCGLLQLASARLPVFPAGQFNHSHRQASLRHKLAAFGPAGIAETERNIL